MQPTFSLGLIAITLAAGTVHAEDAPAASQGLVQIPDYTLDLQHRTQLTGDWGGTRTELANKGMQFDVNWTQYVQSVVDGGRDTSTLYGGHLDYLIKLDLMRMGVLPGALVTVRAESRYGNSVNGIAGPILPVNTAAFFPLTDELDEGVPITVTNLNYTQFLSEKFAILIGKIDTLDGDPNEFASGRGKSQFMNANFLFNSTLALRLPYSTIGGGVVWLPSPNIKVAGMIFNSLDSSTTTGFGDFDDGQTATLEADFRYRLGELPGGFNVGGLYSFDQDFSQFGGQLIFHPGEGFSIPDENNTWAVYASGWQYLFVEDPSDKPINLGDGRADHQGIGLFARLGFADKDTNPIEWSASGGIGGRGIIPTRDNDTFGVGYYYTRFQESRFNSAVGVDDNGQGIEAFYNLAITPAAQLTFDVQVQDTAFPNVDTSVILGMRLSIDF